jgi:hypothetical protein
MGFFDKLFGKEKNKVMAFSSVSKENLKPDPDLENVYLTTIAVDSLVIEVSIDPDDEELEKTIALANKTIGEFNNYESKARRKIIEDFLDNYNENWRDKNEPEIDEKSFNQNLNLTSIAFLADSCIDFYYSENGLFGNHSLVAQSFDGENFNDTEMQG